MRAAAAFSFALLLVATGAEAARVNVTLKLDPERRAGADAEGRVLLYTPRPFEPGSSVSHFDVSASPNLLMEPGVSSDLPPGEVDLTRAAMQDLGWRRGGFTASIEYTDPAGIGFDDPDLGAARRGAFEFAVARWARLLGSPVEVNIETRFRDFECSEAGGVLAAAGPNFAFIDIPGTDPGVWHTGPLAESLAGNDLSAGTSDGADLSVFFNQEIDNGCLGAGTSYYYGTDDGASSNEISFVTVAMHELGHGLGFTPLSDGVTGELFQGSTDVFTRLIFDNRVGKSWDDLNDNQRRKSARRPQKVVLDGRRTTRAAADLLAGSDVLEVHRPRSVAGTYEVGSAVFGPPLTEAGVRGDLALVDDGSAQPTFGCDPLINAAEVAGKVALIDRGECFFTVKVKNAQDAGAIAAVIIHNEPGAPPGLGGADPTIEIPSVRVGQKDGRKLKRRVQR